MKHKNFLLLIAFVSTTCLADFQTGNQIKSICDSTSDVSRGICLGYVTAIVDSNAGTKFCPPLTVTGGQVESIAKKFFNDNPEKLHLSATSVIVEAMSRAFPCQVRR